MFRVRSGFCVLVLTSAFAQLAPPAPVPTSAPNVSAEAQKHIESARLAAGTMWEGVFQPVCNGAVSLATPPRRAPAEPAPGRGGAGRAAGRAAGAPAGPARETWYAEPQKVFDNLYFVGQTEYSAWAITTSQGIILLDAIYDYSVEAEVDEGLRKLGLNPADIKYVIVSHGHLDHAGGAKFLQEKYGARLIMSAADYDLLDQQNPTWKPKRDMVATDGMKLTLGDFTMTLYLTPGHTEGTISTIFPVRDGSARHVVVDVGRHAVQLRTESSAARVVRAAGGAVSRDRHEGGCRRDALESHGLRRQQGEAAGGQGAQAGRAAPVRHRHRRGAPLPDGRWRVREGGGRDRAGARRSFES